MPSKSMNERFTPNLLEIKRKKNVKIHRCPDLNDARGLTCDINVHANFDTCKLIYDYIHTRIMST